jgi:uncharacterized paraquat-inducible protein A
MNTIYDDIFCKFISKDQHHYICSSCGLRVTVTNPGDAPPFFPCSKPLRREPEQSTVSFGQKIKNFAGSLINHVSAGLPTCTDQQIAERHNICMSCEFFKDDTCSKCGCPLTRNKQFLSKLAWSDQSCPVGKWGPIK